MHGPTHEPVPEGKPNMTSFLGKLLAEAAKNPPSGEPKETLPKDDPQFIQKYVNVAVYCEQELPLRQACPCPRCKLALFEVQVTQFVCRETVAAAYTGDTSKLQAILDCVEKLKAGTPAV